MSLKQQAVLGMRWSAIQSWGSQAGSLVVFLVLARLLAPEAFGLLALANVLYTGATLLGELGLGQALVQREDLAPDHLDTAFWVQLGTGVALTLLFVVASGPLAGAFGQPELGPVLRVLALGLVVHALGKAPEALMRRRFAFRALAVSAVVGVVASGVVAVPMALRGLGVWSLVGQQLTYEVVSVGVLFVSSDWRPRLACSRRRFRELFDFGSSVLAFQLLNHAARRTDHFLVGYFLGEVALGFYAVARRVLTVMGQVLSSSVRQVALAAFSRMQADRERLRLVVVQGSALAALVAFPVFLGTAAVAPELVPLLFGAQWMEAVPLIRVLTLAGVVGAVSGLLEMVLLATGRPDLRLRLGALNVVFSLLACLAAVRFGLLAVAIAYVVGQSAVFPFVYRAAVHAAHAGGARAWRGLVPPLAASLAMLGGVLAARRLLPGLAPLPFLGIAVPLGALLYAGVVQLLAPALLREFRSLVWMALPGRGTASGPGEHDG